MLNPDPKKFRIKKLRNKGYVLIPLQVIRWRKKRRKLLKAEKAKNQVESLYKAAPIKPVDAPRIEKEAAVNTITQIISKTPFYDFFGGSNE